MSKFYAVKQQPVGQTVHVFESESDRDSFVIKNIHSYTVPASDVPGVLNSKGVYTRFATPDDQKRHLA